MSYVVDYKRLRRINISDPPEKFNGNHIVMVVGALFVLYIYKRIKDKKSYESP